MKSDTALLVIDVQVGMFPEADPVYAGDALLERIRELSAKARSAGVPVVYVQHNEGVGEPLEPDTPDWQIHPAITPVPGELIVQKHTPDSFHETELHERLTNMGISKLVVTGLQTDMCINATCRGAHNLGYEVTLAQDAHSTWGQGDVTAAQIIEQYNDFLRPFANVRDSADISF